MSQEHNHPVFHSIDYCWACGAKLEPQAKPGFIKYCLMDGRRIMLSTCPNWRWYKPWHYRESM
jgi:hypothetical protein